MFLSPTFPSSAQVAHEASHRSQTNLGSPLVVHPSSHLALQVDSASLAIRNVKPVSVFQQVKQKSLSEPQPLHGQLHTVKGVYSSLSIAITWAASSKVLITNGIRPLFVNGFLIVSSVTVIEAVYWSLKTSVIVTFFAGKSKAHLSGPNAWWVAPPQPLTGYLKRTWSVHSSVMTPPSLIGLTGVKVMVYEASPP